ncbi:hypothetical protein APHAL10511_000742, partial [Amanita phalloides]
MDETSDDERISGGFNDLRAGLLIDDLADELDEGGDGRDAENEDDGGHTNTRPRAPSSKGKGK